MKSYDDLQSHPVSAAIGIEKKKAAPLKRERVEISACKTDSKKPLKKVKGTHHVASKSNTGGLNKPMELSKPLATLLGVVQESRCQVCTISTITNRTHCLREHVFTIDIDLRVNSVSVPPPLDTIE